MCELLEVPHNYEKIEILILSSNQVHRAQPAVVPDVPEMWTLKATVLSVLHQAVSNYPGLPWEANSRRGWLIVGMFVCFYGIGLRLYRDGYELGKDVLRANILVYMVGTS